MYTMHIKVLATSYSLICHNISILKSRLNITNNISMYHDKYRHIDILPITSAGDEKTHSLLGSSGACLCRKNGNG